MDSEAVHTRLQQDLSEARKKARIALDRFNAILTETPTGIPYPDGVQHIRAASREHSAAREAVMSALRRLNDFVIHGTIPEDMK